VSHRPNILYLHAHDVGRHIGPYGHAVQTPSLQQLAEQGVLFRQAFAAAPTCSPSRAALLTGQSPHESGMTGLAHRGFSLTDPGQHLAAHLRRHGYRTVLAGGQHVTAGDPAALGYDVVTAPAAPDVGNAAPIAAQALEWLGASPNGIPFFLDVGFSEAHRPFRAVDASAGRYLRPPAPIPDTPETRMDTAGFLAEVQEVDRGAGIVLDALDRSGLAESTLVICTTDHGPAFPSMKATLTDHGLGVMLLMRGPGDFTGGQVIDALVSQIDLYPTICDLAGIPHPGWLRGSSLLPLVSGETSSLHDAIFGEQTFHAAYEPQRTVRTSRWRYIRRYGEGTSLVKPNVDHGPSRDVWMAHGWTDSVIDAEQLYDCLFDPNQACNLAMDDRLQHGKAELSDRLDRWMCESNDPLIAGDVALPHGASVNRASGDSPDGELVSTGSW
jgi:arylsulfatase A-like enzyme